MVPALHCQHPHGLKIHEIVSLEDHAAVIESQVVLPMCTLMSLLPHLCHQSNLRTQYWLCHSC